MAGRPLHIVRAASAAIAAATLVAGCTVSKHAASATSSPAGSGPGSTAPSQPVSPLATSSAASAASAATSSAPSSSAPAASQTSTTSPTPAASAAGSNHPTAIWPTYHHDAARTGATTTATAVTALKVSATAKLDGAIYASPLVLHDSTGNLIIAATENDTVYGLRDNGSVVWSHHIGTAVNGSSLPCGDISPSGITSTPVYDPSSGLVFAVAFLSGDQHVLVAMNAETGAVAWTRPVDAPGSHANVEQQRGALVLDDGKVWIAYGGLYGDCGPYHGYLVGIATNGQGAAAIYEDPTIREGGFWAPTGPAVDAAGHLYVGVGNGGATTPTAKYDMSDGVIELNAASVLSYFAPTTWASDNAHDFGTTGVVALPDGYVFINGKSGIAYLLPQGNLGGITSSADAIAVCKAFGGPAYSAGMVFVPCTDGLRAVKISGTPATVMTTAWHASPPGTPIVGGGVVLSLNENGTLYALDPATGAVRAQVSVGDATTRFASPSISDDGHAYVGTAHGDLVVIATG